MMRGLSVLLVCFLVLLARPARAQESDTWLIAIGNNLGDRGETSLLYAERDAQEVATALRTVGGLSGRRTTLVLGEQAESVRRTLIDINADIRAAVAEGRKTVLIVFYSGHADADALHLGGSRLPFEELRKMVVGSSATMRMLFVDACRSGNVTRVKGVTPASSFAINLQDQTAAEGTAIVTSSAAGETSQESDQLKGSFFTHHFINALRGAADRDADGAVTLSEAYAYTYAQTLRSTGRTLSLQHPTYSYDVKGRAPVILSRPGSANVQLGALRLGQVATYLVTQGKANGAVVAELAPEDPRARVMLPAGSYEVQERLPTEYREYKVELGVGREVDLERTPYVSARYDQLVRKRGGPRDRSQGAFALGAARGETVAGEGVTPHLVVGYGIDFPWASAAARLRLSRTDSADTQGISTGHHDELGGGLGFARVMDLPWLSIGVGLTVEGVWHRQTRRTESQSSTRDAWGFNFGGLASLERHVFQGAALRLEGGPVSVLYRKATTDFGAQTGRELTSRLTYWAAGGLVWRH